MALRLRAACGSNTGKIRSNNEDNFYFDGRAMAMNNDGFAGIAAKKLPLTAECCFGVFDGMGGVEYGEVASFVAAQTLKSRLKDPNRRPAMPRSFLEEACASMNAAICRESRKLTSGRMGTTAAMLLLVPDAAYVCNLGDSRVYRLRDKEIIQLSKDHVETFPADMRVRRKPRLTQYLGVYPQEMIIEPYIAKGDLRKGDVYVICSDGLTDMLTPLEICRCVKEHASPSRAAEHLISSALNNGGRDNVTVIVIKVQ